MTRDVSDVTHRKCVLRFEKSQLVEFLPRKKKVNFRGSSWLNEFVRYGRRALVGLRGDYVKAVSIEGLCLSLLYSYLNVHASQRHNIKDRRMKDNARRKEAGRLL